MPPRVRKHSEEECILAQSVARGQTQSQPLCRRVAAAGCDGAGYRSASDAGNGRAAPSGTTTPTRSLVRTDGTAIEQPRLTKTVAHRAQQLRRTPLQLRAGRRLLLRVHLRRA